jgi:hypothetical protein
VKLFRLVPLAAVAVVATAGLSGCTQVGSHAAQVGDQVITNDDVSFLTRMQCDALDKAALDPAQSGSVQATPTRLVRAQMLNALIQGALDNQLGAAQHADYDRATFRAAMDQFEAAVQAAPPADRNRFRDVVAGFYRGQLEVLTLAEAGLAQAGVTQPNQQIVQQAISALEADYRKKVTITVNPVYGANAGGVAGSVEPSLSLPVSAFAKDASSSTPSAGFVAGLPTNQRCG